jgi:hypothetical protein
LFRYSRGQARIGFAPVLLLLDDKAERLFPEDRAVRRPRVHIAHMRA